MRRPRSFKAKNRRRIELIHKKYDAGLTEEETAELEVWEREVGEYIARKCPRDGFVLDEMEARLKELKAKIKAKKENQ